MSRGSRSAPVMLLAVVVLAACGQWRPPAVEIEVQDGHRAEFVGALKVGRTLHMIGHDEPIEMSSPESGAGLPFPWRKAFTECLTGTISCVTTGDAVVTLARVDGPAGLPPDGGKMFSDELSYVIVWDPAPCSPAVSPGPAAVCRLVYVVPGKAGVVTYGFEIDARDSFPR